MKENGQRKRRTVWIWRRAIASNPVQAEPTQPTKERNSTCGYLYVYTNCPDLIGHAKENNRHFLVVEGQAGFLAGKITGSRCWFGSVLGCCFTYRVGVCAHLKKRTSPSTPSAIHNLSPHPKGIPPRVMATREVPFRSAMYNVIISKLQPPARATCAAGQVDTWKSFSNVVSHFDMPRR